MRNTSKIAVASLVLATVALPATAFASTMKKSPTFVTYHVDATGAGVTGAMGIKTSAYAKGIVTVNSKTDRLCYNIVSKGLAGVTASHIHMGKKGVDGPVVVTLNFKKFTAMSPSLTCVSVPAATAKAMIGAPADYYLNVHTTKFPNGAVRSQL